MERVRISQEQFERMEFLLTDISNSLRMGQDRMTLKQEKKEASWNRLHDCKGKIKCPSCKVEMSTEKAEETDEGYSLECPKCNIQFGP